MTNEAILSLFDQLCNDARNAMHASFGLMEFQPDPASGADWQTCLDASRRSADRLLRNIDDMRELVSGETPIVGPAEEFDFGMCVGEVVGLLNLAAEEGDARLTIESVDAAFAIRQNREAVEQVVGRILKAALKLSRAGVVRVALSAADESRVRLNLIPPSYDVAQQMADWVNGGVEQLASKKEGLCTPISLLVAGRRLRALEGSAEFTCASGAPTCLAIYFPREPANPEGQSLLTAAERPLQVLVAEDCDESYALTELLLRSESVDRARNGIEAIEKVMRRRFDVILMDIHMPGMDGYESIRRIRDWETQAGHARTSIVVLSSDDVGTQKSGAAQSGCSGFLRKPVRQAELLDLLEPLRASRNLLV